MRIGVNIPDELHSRMEPLKQLINVSQVCREAITAYVERYERMNEGLDVDGVEEVVNQLWYEEERRMLEDDWPELGYQDAKAWVQKATLKDWERLHHMQGVVKKLRGLTWLVPVPHLSGVKGFTERWDKLMEDIDERSDDFQWDYFEQDGFDTSPAHEEYMRAWLTYTEAVWQRYTQTRAQYLEERRQAQDEERANRPAPEVPPHLLPEPRHQAEKPKFRVVPHHGKFVDGIDPLKLNQL